MKNIVILALPVLFCGASILAGGWDKESDVFSKAHTLIHYGTHMATNRAANEVINTIIKEMEATITLNCAKDPMLKNSPSLSIARAIGYLSAFFILYKTPQWTDTYFLGIDTKRSRKQNMIRFMHSFFFEKAGAFTGEYFARCCEASSPL
jgi:hypothetical protein